MVPVSRRLRQEDHKVNTSLGNTVRSCQQTNKLTNQQTNLKITSVYIFCG